MEYAVAFLSIVGFVVTAGGIVAAYRSAKRALANEDRRVEMSERLQREEHAEHEALRAEKLEKSVEDSEAEAINARYESYYSEAGLVRPTLEALGHLAAYESKRLAVDVLVSTRGNLIWAGVGLLISTGASVWSLFI